MQVYLDTLREVLEHGQWSTNRTGIRSKYLLGKMLKFDLAEGFPVVTTKKLAWKSAFAEMLGFFRGYDNAELFRQVGSRVWDDNANKNQQWLNNPHRIGEDDLGRIYGVQARRWSTGESSSPIDQVYSVYEKLLSGIDDRRLLVNHWNVSDLDKMALPPCHTQYQFGIDKDNRLSMCLYLRSSDLFLGLPYNIAGYAWLLSVMAKITNWQPGVLTVFLFNYHIYENTLSQIETQLSRAPLTLPRLVISPRIRSFADLESLATVSDFELEDYVAHDPLPAKMAI